MVAAAFSYPGQMMGYALTAARYFNVQMPLFSFVTLTVIVGSYLLIPVHGLRGAAVAILIAMIVQLVGCLAVLGTAVGQAGRCVREPVPTL
jgi:O-antigen/teichoic acid export membrane protein